MKPALFIFLLLATAVNAQKRGDIPAARTKPPEPIGDIGPTTHFGWLTSVGIPPQKNCKRPKKMRGELTCRTYLKYPRDRNIHGQISFRSWDPASDEDNRYRYLIVPDDGKGAWIQGRPGHTIYVEVDWR
jgi:hypothetical protein